MVKRVLDVEAIIQPHSLAAQIADHWMEWSSFREPKIEEWKELRNYVYATDTRTTTNAKLDWSNSTTTPKLTQIRDNLHANYFAALFPNRKWMRWEGDDEESVKMGKVKSIQAYMDNKIRQSDFILTMSQLIDDFILFGNAFAFVDYESNYNEVDGEVISGYVGPKVYRISPYDVVFNPTASEFVNTPKIIKSVRMLGEIKDKDPDLFSQIMSNRDAVRTAASGGYNFDKSDGYVADGFGSIQEYYGSSYVEILTFYGDIYDTASQELMRNKIIKVVDRAYVLEESDNPSWLGSAPIFHIGWRERPDNLYAMGPLDNLVGLQYRIDHLENMKADVYDQIALGILKVRGEVEDFEYKPGERIYMGDDGDVSYLVPDTTALNADFQISQLENKMEEMAGAPKTAMGIRTPGEKTAFEVDTLSNAANRIFQHKAAHFERAFIEKILNSMLEQARRNIDVVDKVRVLDETTGAQMFLSITKEDITAKGKIIPVGARHFAERARRLQELNNLMSVKANDPTIGVHLSGKLMAKVMAEELGESALFGENISIYEQMETEKQVQEAQVAMAEEQEIAAQLGL